MEKDQKEAIITGIIVLILFIVMSALVQFYLKDIKNYLGEGIEGVLIYLLILIVLAIFAPVSDIPLIPLAVGLWGWLLAAILALIGWTLGALLAFVIARKFGMPLVQRFISIKKVHKYEKLLTRGNYFYSALIIRLLIPLDIISYAFGLFSKIKTKTYLLATFISFIPYTFALAYIGGLSIVYQIVITLIGLVIALIVWITHILRKFNLPSEK